MHADDERGRDDAAPEAERTADPGGEAVGDVGPQHIEGPVRDIDDAGDAEDQRQAGGDKEQPGGGGEPVERLEQECAEGHDEHRLSPRRGERLAKQHCNRFQSPAGRSFLTSASDGSTEAPSTYLKSTMVPLPFSSAILPTKAPMVA